MPKSDGKKNLNGNGWTPSHDEVAARAYEIYLRNGAEEGRDLDNWLQAEAELRQGDGANAHRSPTTGNSASATIAASAPTTPMLTNSVLAETSPIATATRSTTPRRSTRRETTSAR